MDVLLRRGGICRTFIVILVVLAGIDAACPFDNMRRASQSSTNHGGHAVRAIDKHFNAHWGAGSCTLTRPSTEPWFQLDLVCTKKVTGVSLLNRADCCGHHLRNFDIEVGLHPASSGRGKNGICAYQEYEVQQGKSKTFKCAKTLEGRYVIVRMRPRPNQILTICEIGVTTEDITPTVLSKFCGNRQNLNCHHYNYGTLFEASTQQCLEICLRDNRCKSVVSIGGTRCQQKTGVCNNNQLVFLDQATNYVRKANSNENCAKYEKRLDAVAGFCMRPFQDCRGNTLKYHRSTSLTNCKNECARRGDCKSFMTSNSGECWLKKHDCQHNQLHFFNRGNEYVKRDKSESCQDVFDKLGLRPAESKRADLVTRFCPARKHLDCPENNIKHPYQGAVVSEETCRFLCFQNDACLSFVYYQHKCHMKSALCGQRKTVRFLYSAKHYIKNRHRNRNCNSFVIRLDSHPGYCELPNVDCPGNDIDKWYSREDACRTRCTKKWQCKTFIATKYFCWIKHHKCRLNELKPIGFSSMRRSKEDLWAQTAAKRPSGWSCDEFYASLQ